MKELSVSQQKIYAYLKRATAGGIPPSVREICAATGLSSTSTVHSHLKTLERYGYISRTQGRNRAITMAGAQSTAQVPVLGTVTAGVPILAVQDVQGYIPFPDKGDRTLFALKVKGLSMRDVGILDGDYVIVEKQSIARDGEIVVALIEDEATVKTFYMENKVVRLQPENPDFEPIFPETVIVLGKVIAQMRYY